MTDLETLRAEAAEHRATFLRLHREACIALGKYCIAMGQIQEATRASAIPNWGGNPELENKLSALLIKEPPMRALFRSGLRPHQGWGYGKSCEVAPVEVA
jgi:hypothetical protein